MQIGTDADSLSGKTGNIPPPIGSEKPQYTERKRLYFKPFAPFSHESNGRALNQRRYYDRMYPDFLIIRKDGQGFVIDILEPHDGSKKDNLGKARGFAEYARQNPDVGRLQQIRLLNGRIKRLDMSHSAVRDRISRAKSNDEIDHTIFLTRMVFSDKGW